MTWLLQPLDVYVFLQFKQLLRMRYHDALTAGMGPGSVESFLPVLYSVIRDVVEGRRWPHIFVNVGIGDTQARVRTYIKKHLQWP